MLTPAYRCLPFKPGICLVKSQTQRIVMMFIVSMVGLTIAACGDSSAANQAAPAAATVTQQPSPTVTATPSPSVATEPAATATPAPSPAVSVQVPTVPPAAVTLPTPRPIERTEPPVRLRIPTLGVDAAVQWVGIDADGRMGIPSNYDDVAWYEPGPAPGTPGNSVIAGHLDSTTGPAIFFKLRDLKPGDEIISLTAAGKEYRFVVTTSEVYDADNAPLDRIFGTSVNPRLNLITCDGAFDRSSREYDKRLVVYSELATD